MTEHARPNQDVRERVIPSTVEEGQDAQNELLECIATHGWDSKSIFGIRLALEEALVNAIKHGNDRNPDKKIHLRYRVSTQEVHIEVEDEGAGFDPDSIPDPTLPENLEKPSGRGLMLMHAYMTRVDFNARGNCVTLVKRRDSAPASQASA